MRTREALVILLLSVAACDLRCNAESNAVLAVDPDGDGKAKADPKAGAKAEGKTDGKAEAEGAPRRTVEVEVEPTVCDSLDLEIERIVLVPADPPFHAVPRERVSIRVANDGAQAVQLDSGTEASFLDERRTVVTADLHQSDWFMPLTVPAKSAVVVQILVPEGAGKALRTVEVEASPSSDPFSDCKVTNDLLGTPPTATPSAATPI